MADELPKQWWALILGGSSGFGLATAQELARRGMSICIVHRDRRAALKGIEEEFDKIRQRGVSLISFNKNALDSDRRSEILDELQDHLAERRGKVRLMLHSIAFGNLKLIAPERRRERPGNAALAEALGIEEAKLVEAADRLFEQGVDQLRELATPAAYPSEAYAGEDDFARTIHAMGSSLLGWTQELQRREMFTPDARVLGLTSEGNQVAWKGYAAVAAAKVVLESVCRAIAVEMAPYGIRCNIVQAGVTDTRALRLIPGSAQLKAAARLRNPFRRLTTPEDVAKVLTLLTLPEAAWINGEVIRVDGGEHVSGL